MNFKKEIVYYLLMLKTETLAWIISQGENKLNV